MDSLEVEVETENDLDYKYQKMTDAKTYKIWVNNMEKEPNEEEVKSEKYARYLKHKEYEESSKTKQALTQNVNNVLKGISKYKALRGEAETRVPPSNDDTCKAKYLQERSAVLSQLSKDPTSILGKLLQDKLKI